MKRQAPRWWIVVTCGDEENNGFIILGSVGCDTPAEWEQQWQALQLASAGAEPAMLIADKFNQQAERVDEKCINAASAARLLGRPLTELMPSATAIDLEPTLSASA